MLIDEIRELLKNSEVNMAAIRTFWSNANISDTFKIVDKQLNAEDFWKNPDKETILAQHRKLKHFVEAYNSIDQNYKDYVELVEMFKDNEEELANITGEIAALSRKIAKFKLELLLNKEEDSKNCYLSINAGAGGTESQDWAQILMRMFLRFCEREDYKVDILDYQAGEEAGIKSATLYIRGKNAYGFLKTEYGIHRLVRISPFDSNKRRHTSFAGVTVIPEVADDAKIELNDADLKIDTYRAGGAGGQHVNKTDSAIRITHIPSGIVVQCQNERSQGQNKQIALKILKSRLLQKQIDERKAKDDALERKKIEWGSQIRSYVLHPYKMVKDHRTDYESPQPDAVLDGDLMPFIETYLLMVSKLEADAKK